MDQNVSAEDFPEIARNNVQTNITIKNDMLLVFASSRSHRYKKKQQTQSDIQTVSLNHK
jgi:hypothetical protein